MKMYFDLVSGEARAEGCGSCIHCDEDFIWFNLEIGQISVKLSSSELREFCNFLDASYNSKEYIERMIIGYALIALERVNESSRNLCIYDDKLALIFNLKVDVISALSNYLRRYII